MTIWIDFTRGLPQMLDGTVQRCLFQDLNQLFSQDWSAEVLTKLLVAA